MSSKSFPQKINIWLGHFTLYKNNARICSLFKESVDYRKVFANTKKVYSFDECNYLWYPLLAEIPIGNLSYEVQSMTHVVQLLNRQEKIKLYLKNHIAEQDKLIRVNNEHHVAPFKDVLKWQNGKLVDNETGYEYLYMHFHFLKKTMTFNIPKWKTIPQTFYISSKGFFSKLA